MSKYRKTKYKKKLKKKSPILIFIGIAIFIVIVAIAIFARSPNSISQGIPIYDGTSIAAYIDPSAIRNFTKDLLRYVNCTNNLCIVMFGSKECPHCLAMYNFFTGNPKYRDIYTVLWLYENQKANELFIQLSGIEINSGVGPWIAGGVPQILVIRDGDTQAIVVGEVRDQSFWDRIIRLS